MNDDTAATSSNATGSIAPSSDASAASSDAATAVDDEFEQVCNSLSPFEFELVNNLPLPLSEVYSNQCDSEDDRSTVLKKAEQVFQALEITDNEVKSIEVATRAQNNSSEWKKQRRGRITASAFHDILVRKDSTAPETIVERLLYDTKNLKNVLAIKWGREKEDVARTEYQTRKQQTHTNFKCTLSGLVVNPLYPHLGASPDGVIECDCCGVGLLEIKCPYSARLSHPKDMRDKTNFFMKANGLSHTHRYYTQVQGQLAICDKNFCDFVVWTPKGFITERIFRNNNFWEKLITKLTNFYVEHVLPEIMMKKKEAAATGSENDNPEKTYCVCNGLDEGRMIGCASGSSCKIEWFHYKCVGIKRAPKGDWFCDSCKH